ncbi:MAG: DUF6079 family protein, partial [Mycobacteriales bacterium]
MSPLGPIGTQPTIAELVEVPPVETVVRLDGRPGRLEELVLTGDVVGSLSSVLEAAASTTGAGFFVVGHFGAGKSHFLAAVGELLAEPAEVTRLAGWPGTLRTLAAGAREHLVVAVPLVEYRADAVLEDVVAARAWAATDTPAVARDTDRLAAWDRVLGAARSGGHQGLVLLLDELSEFLRAKQGPALTEDLRFLQFLGEWSRQRPVIVVCALQESIEEVVNVSERELARIRDRYRPSLTLTMRHVEDVVRGRLVRLRPGAEEWIDRAHQELQAAFPGWPVPLERFRRCYPVHPETLDLLEGLRFLFSQQRGVVDFIHRQLSGDTVAGIPPWSAQGYRQLITPDRVYDHFRTRIHERSETGQLTDAVVPHYERAVDEMFDNPSDRVLALRTVKLLCLLAASPLERPRTAGELAGMLQSEVSALDPQVNVSYLEDAVLIPLVARGAYVVVSDGQPPRYTVALQADAAVVVGARLAQVRADLTMGDRRLVRTLIELGSTRILPLQLLAELGPSRRELLWQNTLRSLVVAPVRLTELTPGEVDDLAAQAREAGAEGCLLVAEPELVEPDLFDRARQLIGSDARLAVWAPARLSAQETDMLLDVHARRTVLDEARREGRTQPGGLVEYLERAAEADAARVREALRRCYFGGRVVYPERSAAVDLPSLAGLPFERQLPALADPLLTGLHPGHQGVAPRGELVGERLVRQLVTEVLAQGRLGRAALGQLRPLVEGYLVPLGLVRRQRDAIVVAPDPVRSPAVFEVLRLLDGREPVAGPDVVRELADGPVGLTEPEALLVLNACVQAGLIEAWRGRHRLTEPFLAVTSADRFGVSELVEPAVREAVAALSPITGRGPFEPWNTAVQQDAWDHARAWLESHRENVTQVRNGLARLDDSALPTDSAAESLYADLTLVDETLAA